MFALEIHLCQQILDLILLLLIHLLSLFARCRSHDLDKCQDENGCLQHLWIHTHTSYPYASRMHRWACLTGWTCADILADGPCNRKQNLDPTLALDWMGKSEIWPCNRCMNCKYDLCITNVRFISRFYYPGSKEVNAFTANWRMITIGGAHLSS